MGVSLIVNLQPQKVILPISQGHESLGRADFSGCAKSGEWFKSAFTYQTFYYTPFVVVGRLTISKHGTQGSGSRPPRNHWVIPKWTVNSRGLVPNPKRKGPVHAVANTQA